MTPWYMDRFWARRVEPTLDGFRMLPFAARREGRALKGEGHRKRRVEAHHVPNIAAMASTRLRTLSWVMGESQQKSYPCTVAFVSYTVTWAP